MSELESRREARRRRILENAESRLQRISNALDDDHPGPPKPQPAQHDASSDNDSPPVTSIYENGNFTGRSASSFAGGQSPTAIANDEDIRSVVIMGLALFTTVFQFIVVKLHKIGVEGTPTFMNKIFAPFLLYELVDVIANRRGAVAPTNAVASVLLLFANVPPRASRAIVMALGVGAQVLQDLVVYFFIYVTANLLMDTIIHCVY